MSSFFYRIYIVFFLSIVIAIAFIIYWFFYRRKEKAEKIITITNQLEDTHDGNSIYYNGSRTLTLTEASQLQLLTKSASQSTSSNKLAQEEFYEAQCVDNRVNYINYLVNPVPSYEEIAEDLKIERPIPLSAPIYRFGTNTSINTNINTNMNSNISTNMNMEKKENMEKKKDKDKDTKINIINLNNNNEICVEVEPSIPIETKIESNDHI
ncbi:hypothetical protein H8356DRAFT_1669672 [Neocallimastix lanati (nom. inval.)]|nr:hypothetical protein H8356DRAFT_1669672 [Neocallimastix sp. JGI-2020a]